VLNPRSLAIMDDRGKAVCAALKSARIRSIAFEAPGVLWFELTDPLDAELPAFRPGAHVPGRKA
jgi:hypothetical protein